VIRTVRMLGAIALACGTVPILGVGPAHADTTTLSGVTAGYFSSTGIRKPDESPQGVPDALQPNNNGADGVSAGNLAVSARADQVDKLSFVLFDLLSLPIGTTIEKAVVTAPLVPNSQTDTTYAAEPAKVVACPAGDEGFFGEDGSSTQDAPSAKCDVASAPAKATADTKAYEFDITKIATSWIDMNDGLAVLPAEGARTTPFQVVFAPVAQWKLSLTYTLPTSTVAPPFAPAPVDVAPPVDLGGFGGSVAPPPAFDSGSAPAPAPVVPAAPAPQAQVAPQPQANNVAATPVALETLRPDTGLWLAGLGLIALLALLSLIMGDSTVATRTGSTSRLTKALADRQRSVRAPRPAFGRALPI
jgi:hypothetical protein